MVALVRRFSARPRLKRSAAGATLSPDTLHHEWSLTGYLESKWFGLWKRACHLSSRCSHWHTSEVCECLDQLVSALPRLDKWGVYFAWIYVLGIVFLQQARNFASSLPVQSHLSMQGLVALSKVYICTYTYIHIHTPVNFVLIYKIQKCVAGHIMTPSTLSANSFYLF